MFDGDYERKEKSKDERKYYRFMKPEKADFPYQIELFSRNPDLMDLDEETYLTPIPTDDDLSSLSAILLDDDFYNYMLCINQGASAPFLWYKPPPNSLHYMSFMEKIRELFF